MKITIRDEYIKLDQLLKFSNLAESGGQAKEFILNGMVKVNGLVEIRRGRKVYKKDVVEFNGEKITVE